MTCEYIEEREGGYYVARTRVSLDSIVSAFRGGESPETIQQNTYRSGRGEQFYDDSQDDDSAGWRETPKKLQLISHPFRDLAIPNSFFDELS